MAIEIEKKYRLTPELHNDIPRRLESVNAVYEGENMEENTIFSLDKLTGAPGILRVRRMDGSTLLTCKRRIPTESAFKQQTEYEVAVSNADEMLSIIAELGLKPSVIYEKHRKTWKLPDCEVVLDVLPFGLYMEIEGTAESIGAAEQLLEFQHIPAEPRTYPALTAQFGNRIGEVAEARFDKNV